MLANITPHRIPLCRSPGASVGTEHRDTPHFTSQSSVGELSSSQASQSANQPTNQPLVIRFVVSSRSLLCCHAPHKHHMINNNIRSSSSTPFHHALHCILLISLGVFCAMSYSDSIRISPRFCSRCYTLKSSFARSAAAAPSNFAAVAALCPRCCCDVPAMAPATGLQSARFAT